MKPQPEFIRINHAAIMFGVSTSAIRRWILAEKLRPYRVSAKLTLLRLSDIRAMVEGSPAESQTA